MSKTPIPAPSTLAGLLALPSLSPAAKCLLIMLVRRAKTSPLGAAQTHDVDEVGASVAQHPDLARAAARELHRADFTDTEGTRVRLIVGSPVLAILDGTDLARAPEDVLAVEAQRISAPPAPDAEVKKAKPAARK